MGFDQPSYEGSMCSPEEKSYKNRNNLSMKKKQIWHKQEILREKNVSYLHMYEKHVSVKRLVENNAVQFLLKMDVNFWT